MPILDRPAVFWTCALYLALVVGIGLWAARRTRDGKDFFIAGQSLGLVVTGLATMSAAFSGFVFIGGPGLTYRLGLASLFICAPVSFTAGLLCWSVGKRLRLLAEVRDVYTIPDAILLRFGSRKAAGLAAVAVLFGTIAYLGAQLQALGVVIEAAFGTREILGEASLPVAMGIGLAVVLFYSVAGGMLAGVYTDLVQGALMVVASIGVFVAALRSTGGLAAITERIIADDSFGPSFLDPLGSVPVFTAIGFFFIFAVGTLGQPHMLHKFYMLKDPRKLRWMPLVVGGSQLLCVLVWVGIGLAVPALVAAGRLPPLADPDHATPVFLLELAPPLLAGLVFAGVLAAIMSSADSFLNIGAAALVRDLPEPSAGPSAPAPLGPLGSRRPRLCRRHLLPPLRRPHRAPGHLRLLHLRRRPRPDARHRPQLERRHGQGRHRLDRHRPHPQPDSGAPRSPDLLPKLAGGAAAGRSPAGRRVAGGFLRRAPAPVLGGEASRRTAERRRSRHGLLMSLRAERHEEQNGMEDRAARSAGASGRPFHQWTRDPRRAARPRRGSVQRQRVFK